MNKCGNCAGNCGSCTACGGALTLTDEEISFLGKLAQIAFMPVCRTVSDETPIYLGDDAIPKETGSLILQCLEKKNLITIDYDKPMKGFDYGDHHPHYRGSIALTSRGQQVLEILEIQGLSD